MDLPTLGRPTSAITGFMPCDSRTSIGPEAVDRAIARHDDQRVGCNHWRGGNAGVVGAEAIERLPVVTREQMHPAGIIAHHHRAAQQQRCAVICGYCRRSYDQARAPSARRHARTKPLLSVPNSNVPSPSMPVAPLAPWLHWVAARAVHPRSQRLPEKARTQTLSSTRLTGATSSTKRSTSFAARRGNRRLPAHGAIVGIEAHHTPRHASHQVSPTAMRDAGLAQHQRLTLALLAPQALARGSVVSRQRTVSGQ